MDNNINNNMQSIKFLDEKTVKLTTDKGVAILDKVPYTKIYDKTEKKYVSLSIPFYTINGDTYV